MDKNGEAYKNMDTEEAKLDDAAKEIFTDLFDETAQNAAQSADLKVREEVAQAMLEKKYPVEEIADVTKLTMDTIVYSIAMKMPRVTPAN